MPVPGFDVPGNYYEPDEEEPEEKYDPGEECGRWDQNAKGGMHPVGLCRLAGTEWCDWECPHNRSDLNRGCHDQTVS